MKLIINNIYDTLFALYNNKEYIEKLYTSLISDFYVWLSRYSNLNREKRYQNDVIFNINNEKDFCQAIIYYIAGMTDNYAIKMYERMNRF